MATVAVYVCPGVQGVYAINSTKEAGTCAPGVGRWQNVVIAEPFDPASLNTVDLSAAFSAGFICLGGPLIFIWGARMVLRALLG